MSDAKIDWHGEIVSVQPRIRLTRSFDQRSHSYLGYSLRIRGVVDGEAREFVVAIGAVAQVKHGLHAGDRISAKGHRVPDERTEVAEVYKVSAIKVVDRRDIVVITPPFVGVPPSLEVYRERGPRRLAARTFSTKCSTCIWGCEMAVEMIVDQWKPSVRRYRRETFCYGPKSCSLYNAGPMRNVPGRQGMSWAEEDWVDGEETSHRGKDD